MRIISFLTILLVCSCSTLKQVRPNINRATLTETSFTNLNGDYEISSSDTARTTLDFALTFKSYRRFDIKSKYIVSLKVLDTRHLQTTIYKNDTLLKTRVIKGKIDNDYFTFNSKKAFPLYLVFNVFGNKTTRIGLLKSNDLLVDCRHFQVATLIVIPLTGGRDEEYDLVFRRQSASH